MKRKKSIEFAFAVVDARDRGLCLICRKPGPGIKNDRAHVIPRNNILGKADDPMGIMTLCRQHHTDYDKNKTMLRRIRWLRNNNLGVFARHIIYQIRIYKATKIVTRNVNKIVDSETINE